MADFKNRLFQMEETVRLLSSRPELGFSLTHVVSAFIGGLAKAERGQDASKYKNYLRTYLPDLCNHIEPDEFYNKIRNASIHEMTVRPPYALHHGGIDGDYVKTLVVEGIQFQSLNVDRLMNDFLVHLNFLRAQMGPRPGGQ